MDREDEHKRTVVDLDYLLCLSKGDADFVKKMISIFIEENPSEIEKFERSILKRDFSAIHASAHKLKSSIPFIGINKIIEREVAEIERLAATHSGINEIERLFPKIDDICRKARAELASYNKI
jgi:HPt (histidine-containing phosphotransfer) domain-containing protein